MTTYIIILISLCISVGMVLNVIKDENMNATAKKGFSINWKDAIWAITLVVGMSSSYFSMKSKVDNQEAKLDKIEKMLNDNNLELIKYKLEQVQKSQDDLSTTFNKFIDEWNKSQRR